MIERQHDLAFDVAVVVVVLQVRGADAESDEHDRPRRASATAPWQRAVPNPAPANTAIKAMTMGAFDYLLKPLDLTRIRDLVRQGIEIRRLMNIPVEMPGAEDCALAKVRPEVVDENASFNVCW